MKQPVFEFENAQGIRFRIYWRKIGKKDLKHCRARSVDGICYSPDSKNPKIIIDPRLKNKRKFEVLIHEIAHAFFWDKREKEITKFAKTTIKFLYFLLKNSK